MVASMPKGPSLSVLVDEVKACTLCAPHLAHAPRPVFRIGSAARVLLIGQAPGAKVHATGVPWQDDSGDHLREWLEVDAAAFNDPNRFAIVPMGFCWPGRRQGGDLPPRPECAPRWHAQVVSQLPQVRLTLLIGQYAQAYYLRDRVQNTLTETVRSFAAYGDSIPLPHPSWRSKIWIKNHPWFTTDLLPVLRERVRQALRSR